MFLFYRLKTTDTSGGSWTIAMLVLLRAYTTSTVYSTHMPLRRADILPLLVAAMCPARPSQALAGQWWW